MIQCYYCKWKSYCMWMFTTKANKIDQNPTKSIKIHAQQPVWTLNSQMKENVNRPLTCIPRKTQSSNILMPETFLMKAQTLLCPVISVSLFHVQNSLNGWWRKGKSWSQNLNLVVASLFYSHYFHLASVIRCLCFTLVCCRLFNVFYYFGCYMTAFLKLFYFIERVKLQLNAHLLLSLVVFF